jgi:hypothetical protein
MRRMTNRNCQAILSILISGSLALTFAPPVGAKRIIKRFRVKSAVSVNRATDGTISVRVVFTTRNPVCFSKKIIKRERDGFFHIVSGALYYADADGYGGPPDHGLLSPVSRPSRTRWIWEAVWPGDAPVFPETHNPDLPYPYRTTVAAASELALLGNPPGGKIKYRRRGTKVRLLCGGSEINKRYTF